jgi:ATPase subunit of ABC transporter with duplicated ATPase domains
MLEDVRLGKLRQDQFAYEEFTVIDTVIMGHEAVAGQGRARPHLLAAGNDRRRRHGRGRAGNQFAEMDGYTAESRAGELLLGLGIPLEQHFGPMSEVAPGWKLRVLLAQALFSDPKCCCSTNRPTTWTSTPSAGWKACSPRVTAP